MSLFDWFRRVEAETAYCDGCGQDYPKGHLEYVKLWDGNFCGTCAIMEDDSQ